MKCIVIADDSETARLFIRRCFEIACRQPIEFLEAGDGEAALALLREHDADLLVTDLTMPGMDGLSLLKRVLASPRLHDVPIMVISSASNPAKEKELRELGACCVLPKPISPVMVAEALARLGATGENAR